MEAKCDNHHLTGASVAEGEVLIGKLGSIDGLPTGTIASSEITTLAHEVRDHTVKGAVDDIITMAKGTK